MLAKMNTAATNASGQLVGGLRMPASSPLASGLVLSFVILGFVLLKVHRTTIQPAMAGTLGGIAILAPVFLGAAGNAHYRGELPGGAKVESWARKAERAAQTVGIDRQQVESLTAEVRTTTAELHDLDSRYRKMVGDTAALTYLMWRVRGQFGALPAEVTDELTRLGNDMLAEAYPDGEERARVVGRINTLSPSTGAGIGMIVR